MNSQKLSTFAAIGFVIFGTVCLELRREALRRDQAARENTYWRLSYDARFDAVGREGQAPPQVRLPIPFDTRCCAVDRHREAARLADESLSAKITRPHAGTGNRSLVISARPESTGPRRAKASFVLCLSPRMNNDYEALTSLPSRERFLRPEIDLPTTEPAVKEVAKLAPADARTDFERLQWAFEYCCGIDSAGEAPTDDAKTALTTRRASPKGRARAMATLCRALGLPTRLVTGFVVRQGADIEPQVWVEVYHHQTWIPFDPTNGYSLTLPMEYVPVRRDADEPFSFQNVANLTVRYAIKRLPPDPRVTEAELQDPLQILDLRRLPVGMHKVMTILLLLPFAALLTAIMRNAVGMGTFGTFSPALLAMSFIYADWKIGFAILLVVFMIGLLGRWGLERLRLLTVPRLGIILTLVILCVVFGLSAVYFMAPTMGAEVVLLPMIILTNFIERFHVSADEDGMVHTMKLALGTLVVALLCYIVLGSQTVGRFVLTYPETHFFTIAVFIVLGRYTGYRLTELWRFRDLASAREAV